MNKNIPRWPASALGGGAGWDFTPGMPRIDAELRRLAECTDPRTGKVYGKCSVVRCKVCPLFKHQPRIIRAHNG